MSENHKTAQEKERPGVRRNAADLGEQVVGARFQDHQNDDEIERVGNSEGREIADNEADGAAVDCLECPMPIQNEAQRETDRIARQVRRDVSESKKIYGKDDGAQCDKCVGSADNKKFRRLPKQLVEVDVAPRAGKAEHCLHMQSSGL